MSKYIDHVTTEERNGGTVSTIHLTEEGKVALSGPVTREQLATLSPSYRPPLGPFRALLIVVMVLGIVAAVLAPILSRS